MWATMKYVSEAWMSIGTAARETPDKPPITNVEIKARAHNTGVFRWSSPSQRVASQEKTLIPVGTAISNVVIIMGIRSQSAMPATNMWCAHTENASTRIPISDTAISRQPKIGFGAETEETVVADAQPR